MSHALDLIVAEGYDGFSMRKLAVRLNIAAKTICNDFHNQDELYLHLLIKGFELVQTWSQMHGYIAGINTALLDYMHNAPLGFKERTIARICQNTRMAINDLSKRPFLVLK